MINSQFVYRKIMVIFEHFEFYSISTVPDMSVEHVVFEPDFIRLIENKSKHFEYMEDLVEWHFLLFSYL